MEKKSGKIGEGRQPTEFAVALRKIRLHAGYSQREVATILRMNRATYTYYELGRTAPDPETLNRISKIFGVPMEAFFTGGDSSLKLEDPGVARKRPNTIKRLDPQRIGDLTTEEKLIIAFLRDKELSPEAVLQALRKRFDVVNDSEG